MAKRNFTVMALTAVLALSIAPMASAADLNTNANGIINFDAIDTDHDGTLTQTEFDTSAKFKGTKFNDVDKNDDGKIDTMELSKWAAENGKGNTVSSVNTRSLIGTEGTVIVPPVNPNVDLETNTKIDGSGAGAAMGAKSHVSGSVNSR